MHHQFNRNHKLQNKTSILAREEMHVFNDMNNDNVHYQLDLGVHSSFYNSLN